MAILRPEIPGSARMNALAWHKRGGRPLDDQEARAILGQIAGVDRLRHPVQQALEYGWFRQILALAGYQGAAIPIATWATDFDPFRFAVKSRGYVANHIRRQVMQQVSRLSANRGVPDVIPHSPDFEDRAATEVARSLIDHYHEALQLDAVRRAANMWSTVNGTAWLYANWDPRKKPKQKTYRNPLDRTKVIASVALSAEDRAFLETIGAVEQDWSGDIDAEALSPFQVTFSHEFSDPKDLPWLCIEHVRSMDWVAQHYPDKIDEIEPDRDDTLRGLFHWRALTSLSDNLELGLSGDFTAQPDSVIVRQWWKPPSPLLKDGALVVGTSTTLLENSPHPLAEHGIMYPVVRQRYFPMTGRMHGAGMVTDLMQPADEYNRAADQQIRQRDQFGQPQLLVPRQCELQFDSNETGDAWYYNAMGGKPEFISPPALGSAQLEGMKMHLDDMRIIGMQSEASQSIVPPGVRSGIALRRLQEADLTALGLVIADQEGAWSQFYSNLLKLISGFMTEPQAIQIYGEGQQIDVKFFQGADLRNNTTVKIRRGSMSPTSRAEAAEHIMDLLQMGAITPAQNPQDRRMVLEVLELGDASRFTSPEDKNRRRARIENNLFLHPEMDPQTGQPRPFPMAVDTDLHEVHALEHQEFIWSDSYEVLPLVRKMAVRAHLQMHQDFITQAQEAQRLLQQQQAMMQAGGAGPGGGSPPKEPGQASQPRKAQPTPGTQ